RKDAAIRHGRRAVELSPASDGYPGYYMQHQLARIYLLTGEPDLALDQIEPLTRVPYFFSPGRLQIDPMFDPLRKHPRFMKLVAPDVLPPETWRRRPGRRRVAPATRSSDRVATTARWVNRHTPPRACSFSTAPRVVAVPRNPAELSAAAARRL